MIGKTLGHYRVLEKLGAGGMGVVYKAQDLHLDRFVAVKILPPEKVADSERKRRFVQEAKAASALNSPNIIHIYDIDEADAIDFIAMEYVPGKTLDELIPRKGLRLSLALKYAIQIADAVARAHGAGIIHRDLKPSNVMVDGQGLVKVLDFGLAKLTEASPAGDDASTRTVEATTEKGTILGTVAYMSPEQAEGKHIDSRSDVFSFGSMLHEMLTGQRAFQGDTKASTIAAILKEEPKSLSQVSEGIPRDAGRIVRRCLRKDPDHRFQTMADLKVALEELKEESDSGGLETASTAKTRQPRKLVWALGLFAALVMGAVGVWLVRYSTHPAPAPQLVQLTSYPGNELAPSFSPDGKQVAFSWNGEKEDNYDIYIKGVEAANALRLTFDPATDTFPAWSPDGKRIAFRRFKQDGSSSVWWVSHLGGEERKISDLPTRSPLSWSSDGKWLAAARQSDANNPNDVGGIFLLPVESGEPRPLIQPRAPVFYTSPAFSPDGTSLAYASCKSPWACDLFLQELDSGYVPKGPPRQITHQGLLVAGVAWSRDGISLVYGGSVSYDITFRLWRTSIVGDRPAERLELAGLRGALPAVAPSGDRLAFALNSAHGNLWRYQIGGAVEPFLKSALYDYDPQFSPDGNKIAFSSDRYGDVLEVWIADADGSHPMQLTRNEGHGQGTPRWSPDGRYIVFDSKDQDGLGHVCIMNASGGQYRQLTSGKFNDYTPSFSHNGKWIYFYSNRTGRDEVWRVELATGVLQQLTENGGMHAFESTDGKSIFYRKQMPNGSSRLFARSLDGGPERQVLDDLLYKAFAVFQDGIYYIGIPGSDKQYPLLFYEFATGAKRLIHKLEIERMTGAGLTVSPDRRIFVAPQTVGGDSNLMLIENFR